MRGGGALQNLMGGRAESIYWGERAWGRGGGFQRKGKYLVNICTVAFKAEKCYFSVKLRLCLLK